MQIKNILGVNLGHTVDKKNIYDGGAALICDGKLIGAISEERLSRKKYCGGFKKSIEFLLKKARLELKDIDLVVVSCYGEEANLDLFGDIGLSLCKRIVMIPSHHLSHAYSAFLPSDFDEALIIIADNEGNIIGPRKYKDTWKNSMERLSVYHGYNKINIKLLEFDMEEENQISLGELYGNITRYLGFESYQNAGKTMALASYGDSTYFSEVPLIKLLPNGRLVCPMENVYYDTNQEIYRFFKEHGYTLPDARKVGDKTEHSKIFKDLAAILQKQLEEALKHKIKYWVKKTGIKKVVLAGGVALNCVANRKIFDDLKLENIFIQPNSGDQGQGLGNVLYGWHVVANKKIKIPINTVYLGGDYENDILDTLKSTNGIKWYKSFSVEKEVASYIKQGLIIGWFQGRSEWGPRALGNRSILADPRTIEIKDKINLLVKHREYFRPFAPVILEEMLNKWFDSSIICPYMTIIATAKSDKIQNIPAVLHVDNTARIQTVNQLQNSKLYNLINCFYDITGVPILLNTSFNDNGEPIVETPKDALNTFLNTNIDLLVMGDYIINKK